MTTQEIDVLKLYAGQIKGFEDHEKWNAWLRDCLKYEKLNQLLAIRKGLQMGISAAEKKKLTTEGLINTYCRWIGSIDKTMRKIVKKRQDLSNDYKSKKQRDSEFETFLRKESY